MAHKVTCTWCHQSTTDGGLKELALACDETHCPMYDVGSPLNAAVKHAMGFINQPFNPVEIATQPAPVVYLQDKKRVKAVYEWPAIEGFIDRREFM